MRLSNIEFSQPFLDSKLSYRRANTKKRKTIKSNQISPYKTLESVRISNTVRTVPFYNSKKTILT